MHALHALIAVAPGPTSVVQPRKAGEQVAHSASALPSTCENSADLNKAQRNTKRAHLLLSRPNAMAARPCGVLSSCHCWKTVQTAQLLASMQMMRRLGHV